jgi:hypothetical protein
MGVSTTSPRSQDMILVTTIINPIFVPIDFCFRIPLCSVTPSGRRNSTPEYPLIQTTCKHLHHSVV